MNKVPFQISSRATILLGRESVSKANGALIELVKNTYDADAEICIIFFDTVSKTLYILDNGAGMSEDIVLNNWMLIGTDNKKIEYISRKERIKSGEKGIGRFALDRLGSSCEMFTKNSDSLHTVRWRTDWEDFEQLGANVNDIYAEYELLETNLYNCLPDYLRKLVNNISMELDPELCQGLNTDFSTGTLFCIRNLREDWTEYSIKATIDDMAFLIPPKEQEDFIIVVHSDISEHPVVIDSNVGEDYDHKLSVHFDGLNFHIKQYRNEYDVERIPDEIFSNPRYFNTPEYSKETFDNNELYTCLSVYHLFGISLDHTKPEDNEFIEGIKLIGPFTFEYIFLKRLASSKNKKIYYYKDVSPNRKKWLEYYSGIKIYRDNFWVRSYGDVSSESFDWLGLDRRVGSNPEAVADPRGNWRVGNTQGQGTVFISRVNNELIKDISSREGLISNETFTLFKRTIIELLSVFERDRAKIANTFNSYHKDINKDEIAKQEGSHIANEILENKQGLNQSKEGNSTSQDDYSSSQKSEKMAKAIKLLESEQEELMSENQLLKSLATNGLLTTAIIHDLRNIKATLLDRSNDILMTIRNNDAELLKDNLDSLKKNDEYLDTWMQIVMEQSKPDKRRRKKENIYQVLQRILDSIDPILKQKKISCALEPTTTNVSKRIFFRDFESILYNLIINSIDAFEKKRNAGQPDKIIIKLNESNENIDILYSDNGPGLDSVFSDPNEILEYGITSKSNALGEKSGMGLGMYIVKTTVKEYNGEIKFPETQNGFSIQLIIPNKTR